MDELLENLKAVKKLDDAAAAKASYENKFEFLGSRDSSQTETSKGFFQTADSLLIDLLLY